MRILLVEDEEDLASALAKALEHEAYAVDLAVDGSSAEEFVFINDYDLVVLDWTIPAPTGIELLGRWRSGGNEMPVLMLTGRDGVEDRVSGLDTGADDYLTKPFSLIEFMARVRSLLRRRDKVLNQALVAGDLEMNRALHRVTIGGVEIELTPKEFATLEYFLTRLDQVVTRTKLIEHVWDDSFDSMSNVVDVTIHRLRSKIDGGGKGKLLQTIKGIGYVLRGARD
ncbi:MAG TPA: response regulator transcription factor [Myxococcales bacterium]|nr:response regulator transcription factor [Myxococcales bacterium]